ncbi:MAG: hypothetical protein WC089_02820 [Candidatus Paceibacterota bacterium]
MIRKILLGLLALALLMIAFISAIYIESFGGFKAYMFDLENLDRKIVGLVGGACLLGGIDILGSFFKNGNSDLKTN